MNARRILQLALFLAIASTGLYAMDSVRVISSFYHDTESIETFKSSSHGDTVCIVYGAAIRSDDNNIKLSHLRVRSWNSRSGASLSTQNFFHKQDADEAATYQVGQLNGTPHLVYTPDVKTLTMVNAVNGTVVHQYPIDDTIRNVYMSPDFTHAVVCTKDDRYSIMNVVSGEVILRDSVYRAYHKVFPPDTAHGLSDSTYLYVHFKIRCRADSWSPDNSLVMLRTDRISDTVVTGEQFRFESYWRPYDLTHRRYLLDTIPFAFRGKWHPDNKFFSSTSGSTLYYQTADTVASSFALGETPADYAISSDNAVLTVIGSDSSYTVWDMATRTKRARYTPGRMLAYCFNSDKNLIAFVTTDTVLHIVNLKTLQGLQEFKIPYYGDPQALDLGALTFLFGSRGMLIRDHQGNFDVLDIATRSVVASLEYGSTYVMSPDGTMLFILGDRINSYDLFTGEKVGSFPESDLHSAARSIALNVDGTKLLSVEASAKISLWDVASSALVRSVSLSAAQQISWSADQSMAMVHRRDSVHEWWTAINSSSLSPMYDFDNGARWLNYSMDKSSQLVSNGLRLLVYALNSKVLIDSVDCPSIPTAATKSFDNSVYLTGDAQGVLRSISCDGHAMRVVYDAQSPIRSIVLSRSNRYASIITDAENVVVRVSDGMRVQKLSRPTQGTEFCQGDTTCVCIYPDFIIRFTTRDQSVLQIPTAGQAYIRPQKNYYVVGIPDARDSLSVFDYYTQKATNVLFNVPTNSEIVWSGDAMRLATVDIFNNIVVWTPGHLKDGESVVDVDFEGEAENSVSLWPQPVSTSFRVLSDLGEQPLEAQLVNVLGHSARLSELGSGSFDTSGFPDGVYIIRLSWNGGRHSAVPCVIRH